ncbi:DUF1670 domain-containing protein [Salicibibacter kimchii]|uniref:DUF1670 domain-containing protein n=1 Tax=Salicibibacter kimchii TaxID=2099786 RepID=A0A345C2E7_9BACI|nr:DUF1670 domain-containing protein [Salicibibacter kimchii]
MKRYLRDFGRVVTCSKKAFTATETAHVVGISERLAHEYLALYRDYNIPEYADRLEDLVTRSNPSMPMSKGKKGAKKA